MAGKLPARSGNIKPSWLMHYFGSPGEAGSKRCLNVVLDPVRLLAAAMARFLSPTSHSKANADSLRRVL
jgi:hypothetical protein